jgi:hypothetical protein
MGTPQVVAVAQVALVLMVLLVQHLVAVVVQERQIHIQAQQ